MTMQQKKQSLDCSRYFYS